MDEHNCILCKKPADSVSRFTVEQIVKDYFKKHLKSYEYGFCENPNCDVVYFNKETDELYFERDLKIPIWPKSHDNPVICYCLNVTLNNIIDEVAVNKSCSTLEELIELTGASKGCRCKSTNPSGKNCLQALNEAFEYAIKIRDNGR